LIFEFFGTFPFGAVLQYGRIIPQFGFKSGDMYKKKKVAALKHRQREKKLKEKRKAQAQAKGQ